MSTVKYKNALNQWETIPSMNGEGIPDGGRTDQVLAKHSNSDGDVEWKTLNIPSTPEAIGAMAQWDLLWENVSPLSNFLPQTVSLSLTEHDAVMIIIERNNSDGTGTHYSLFCNKGMDTRFFKAEVFQQAVYETRRDISVSDSGITFSNAVENSSAGAIDYITNNNNIPILIYGIKGVSST